MILRTANLLKGIDMAHLSVFEPYTMGSHHLANRFVMNPMTRCRADADAVPTAIMADYYGQRATAGLIGARPSTASTMPLVSESSDSPLST